VHWKKTRQVAQTAAAPPNEGKICFAIMGSIKNRSVELANIGIANDFMRRVAAIACKGSAVVMSALKIGSLLATESVGRRTIAVHHYGHVPGQKHVRSVDSATCTQLNRLLPFSAVKSVTFR
jgi:hypothetical protein